MDISKQQVDNVQATIEFINSFDGKVSPLPIFPSVGLFLDGTELVVATSIYYGLSGREDGATIEWVRGCLQKILNGKFRWEEEYDYSLRYHTLRGYLSLISKRGRLGDKDGSISIISEKMGPAASTEHKGLHERYNYDGFIE